ncbi:MAG: hypothetical protein K0Q79_2559 [Flavipsychrobacter sp.]|jgi:hypothetical protein|nr:hypothetical protein [Flavipsychrobacter sp.]
MRMGVMVLNFNRMGIYFKNDANYGLERFFINLATFHEKNNRCP